MKDQASHAKTRTGKWDQTQDAADYRREYNKVHYDALKLSCPKGTVERIDEAARREGMSRTAFVLAAVKEKIDKM